MTNQKPITGGPAHDGQPGIDRLPRPRARGWAWLLACASLAVAAHAQDASAHRQATPAIGASAPSAQSQPTQAQPAQTQTPQDQPPPAADGPSRRPLFIDDAHEPTVTLAWEQRDGTRILLTRTVPWGTKNDRVELGHNVLAFASVGGTRIDLQAGHPLGSVVRVGFYKADNTRPFFADIKPGSFVEVRLEGVRFLEPARPSTHTALHHLQYALQDVLNCGLDGSAIDQYNTASPTDTLKGNVTERNGRPGVLRVVQGAQPEPPEAVYRPRPTDPADPATPATPATPTPGPGAVLERYATVRFLQDPATQAISVRARIPYELFRHVRDPWHRTEPGTFFEPTHFHLEFESLPVRILPSAGDESADQPKNGNQEADPSTDPSTDQPTGQPTDTAPSDDAPPAQAKARANRP